MMEQTLLIRPLMKTSTLQDGVFFLFLFSFVHVRDVLMMYFKIVFGL